MLKKLLLLSLITIQSVSAQSNDQQLIKWFAGADIVGTTADSDSELETDFYVREFEFSAYSAIDHTWNGVLTLAYHKELEANEEHMEIHEAFIQSSKLFNLSTLKIGKFFMGFGRINKFHRHDWSFTDAPFVQKAFFGNEGSKGTGMEFHRNLPSMTSTITFGITKGDEFNHTEHGDEEEAGEHSHSESAKAPTGYIRFAKFFESSTTEGSEIGLNYISRTDSESVHSQYAGIDFIYKKRTGRFISQLIQAELWTKTSRKEHDDEVESNNEQGVYIYYQYGKDRHHSYGLRLDYFNADPMHEEGAAEEHHHSVDGMTIEKEFSSLTVNYTYTNSEFMRTRFSLEHGQGLTIEDAHDDHEHEDETYTKASIQFVFSIGAHPAHVY